MGTRRKSTRSKGTRKNRTNRRMKIKGGAALNNVATEHGNHNGYAFTRNIKRLRTEEEKGKIYELEEKLLQKEGQLNREKQKMMTIVSAESKDLQSKLIRKLMVEIQQIEREIFDAYAPELPPEVGPVTQAEATN